MSAEERFLGNITKFDPVRQTMEIQLDFLSVEQQEIIENMLKEKSEFSFWFNKPFRRSKSYAQLKRYYLLLNTILKKLEVFPDADTIRAFDIEIKKTIFPTQILEVYGAKIPVVPSKSTMSVEEMQHMIEVVQENYAPLLKEIIE